MISDTLAGSLSIVGPEFILVIGAMGLLMVGVFTNAKSAQLVTALSVALLIIAALWLIFVAPQGVAFGGSIVSDSFAAYMKVLVLIGSAAAIVMSAGYAESERFDRFEFPVLIVLSTLGMLVMVSAGDLISLYMGLELQSLAIYVLAAINRDSVRSTEAGLKYFVLGALSSGMLLYGASMVYGFTGQIELSAIAQTLTEGDRSLGLLVGLVFMLAGLAFKISAVPFHMWTPDVYEGAPTPITALLAGAPKIAAMALLVRFAMEGFLPVAVDWQQVIIFISIASMAFGAFAAIGQTNIKRLIAYSSIAHMGFALVGLSAANLEGVRGVALYMAIYLATTLGTFAVILSMRRDDGPVHQIEDLSGLSRTNPAMAVFLTIMMLSLAGLPPLAGFFAKYFVFMAAVEAGFYALAVIGVLSSVIALYYYLRIVKVMWFDEAEKPFLPQPTELKVVLWGAGLFIFPVYLFVGGPVFAAAGQAARSLF